MREHIDVGIAPKGLHGATPSKGCTSESRPSVGYSDILKPVIRRLATDLDGTFWGPDVVLPPEHLEAVGSKISSQMLRTLDHSHGLDAGHVRRFERIVSAHADVFLAFGSFGVSADPLSFFHVSILPNGRTSADRAGCRQAGVL